MIKNLLASAMMIAATLSASASTIEVWSGNTPLKGWSDNITVSAGQFIAASEGSKLVVNLTVDMTLDPATNYTNLGVKTNTDAWPELDGTEFLNPTGDKAEWDINAAAAKQLKETGLIIQGQNVIVTSVDLVTAEDVDPNLLWEGSVALVDWAAGGDISASKLPAGTVIECTFTGTSDGGQAITKSGDWKDLMGTAKITAADMNSGSVVIGITTEAAAQIEGNKFMLQGEKGATLTKIVRLDETFDLEHTLAYGKRALGAEFFCTLPDNAKYLIATLDAKAGWMQFCNGSWADQKPEVEIIEKDGKYEYKATLTADIMTALKTKVIINGGGANILSLSWAADEAESGIENIASDNENAPVEYYNIQGIRIANPENGLFIRKQGNKVTKVIL